MNEQSSSVSIVLASSLAFIVVGCVVVKKRFFPWLKEISRKESEPQAVTAVARKNADE